MDFDVSGLFSLRHFLVFRHNDEGCRFLVETAALAGAVIGSGHRLIRRRVAVRKRYQIDKAKAVRAFREDARKAEEQIQFALALPEVIELVQDF